MYRDDQQTQTGTPVAGGEIALSAPGAALRAAAIDDRRVRDRARRSSRRWARSFLLTDVVMLVAATAAASFGSSVAGLPAPPVIASIGYGGMVLALLASSGVYKRPLRPQLLSDLRSVISATAIAAMSVSFVRIAIADDPHVAAQTARAWLFAAAYLCMAHAALHSAERSARRNGEAGRATLIMGAGEVGALFAKRLLAAPEFGLTPVGFLDTEHAGRAALAGGPPVLGEASDLDRVVAEHHIEQVIIAFSNAPWELETETIHRCRELGLSVSMVPRLFEGTTDRLSVDRLGGLPLLSLQFADPKGWPFAVKHGFDRLLASIAVLVLAPLLGLIAIGVRVTAGGPVLFRQRRTGRDGEQFEMLKFRTMREARGTGATGDRRSGFAPDTAPGGIEGEDRRTRFGTFLRRSSLDELPQLINVLRGEMSIVGPRPERPEFVQRFESAVHRYDQRHRCKSGMTGWAQVQGLRGKTSISDRIEHDNYYIENWSLGLDLKILLLTVLAVFSFDAE